ncbi:LacI family DNA-binding transcriptional regulator [Actinomycetaceae bacterium MB13-C1-2]|nr:LacI family DNA-binding transcriptional regulator [Actinomycetaceae bacterium MB13-C1-2]
MQSPLGINGSTDRVTIREVAILAGVGTKTVSRVMNNEPNVRPETAARVRDAAAKLRYEPDLYAGNLRRRDRSTGSIGLLLADASDPFEASMQRAIEAEVERRGMVMITMSVDENPARQRRAVNEMLRRRVDGLILMPAGRSDGYLTEIQERGLPMVFVDRHADGSAADTILTNNVEASQVAARQLVNLGHRQIALVGKPHEIETERVREQGFLDEVRRTGGEEVDVQVRMGMSDDKETTSVALELLQSSKPPTAFFATQNMITVGTVRALHRLGLQDRVALIGFDDFPLADVLAPGITVLQQNPAEMGRIAARRLLERIDGLEGDPRLDIVVSPLIQRGSGEIRPG